MKCCLHILYIVTVFQRNELKELNLELGKAVPRPAAEVQKRRENMVKKAAVAAAEGEGEGEGEREGEREGMVTGGDTEQPEQEERRWAEEWRPEQEGIEDVLLATMDTME